MLAEFLDCTSEWLKGQPLQYGAHKSLDYPAACFCIFDSPRSNVQSRLLIDPPNDPALYAMGVIGELLEILCRIDPGALR
jgi:hypothetical protein